MARFSIIILLLFLSIQASAQFVKSKSLNIVAGYGLSAPTGEFDINGSGVYAQGEYVLEVTNWVDLRPYAGFVFTSSDYENIEDEPEYEVTTNAFLVGGKLRLTIPLPYVAPYFELGVGASIGSFRTFTPATDIDESGLISHIPISLGLELGRKRKIDIAFTYYFQNSVKQVTGAAAVGISIPLKAK